MNLVKSVLLSVDTLWMTNPQKLLGLEGFSYRHSVEYPFYIVRNRNDERIPFYVSEYHNERLQKAGNNISDSHLYETNLHRVNYFNEGFYTLLTGNSIGRIHGFAFDNYEVDIPFSPPIIIDFSDEDVFPHVVDQIIEDVLQLFYESEPDSPGELSRWMTILEKDEPSRPHKLPSSMNVSIPTILATIVVSDLESISTEIEKYLGKNEDSDFIHVKTDLGCIFGLDPFGPSPDEQHDYVGWKSGYGLVPGHQLCSFFFIFIEGKRSVNEVLHYDTAKGYPKLKQKYLRNTEVESTRHCIEIILEMKEYSLVLDAIFSARDYCVELLDNLPSGNSSNRDKRLQLLLKAHEEIQIHERTQFLIKEWIEYKDNVSSIYYNWPNPRYDELLGTPHVKELLTDSITILHGRGLNLENIALANQSLKNQIDTVEKSIRFRVDIERTAVQFAREKYESKKEFLFNRVSIVLGAFVIFEILGSFLTWYYSQGDIVGILLWISMLVSITVLAVWAFKSKIPENETE